MNAGSNAKCLTQRTQRKTRKLIRLSSLCTRVLWLKRLRIENQDATTRSPNRDFAFGHQYRSLRGRDAGVAGDFHDHRADSAVRHRSGRPENENREGNFRIARGGLHRPRASGFTLATMPSTSTSWETRFTRKCTIRRAMPSICAAIRRCPLALSRWSWTRCANPASKILAW